MPLRTRNVPRSLRSFVAGLLSTAFLLLVVAGAEPRFSVAQNAKQGQPISKAGGNAQLVERGKYIVERVAGCGYCHTPRDKNGDPDRAKWLAGTPVFYE